ncbi:NADH dehydrogenase (ubiquinone) 30 kDa subunit [Desulfurobacterium thermolithotrophum DSM 11699]|uniref:NADH dehydrogenase (Ubiquinone) 30 kDa subunit n=1 Tax=Desulfurobacterium thermolithotrophum (strain DSM 11699 / BSA) TaxID=868864 RepID=F0S0L7_DESTD|nr:NADH-quinone oxidoreductase subunit C [Desulfurobacterium thermolithotrophum]ADY73820.1 NADH dehydrogenase (ubiquinone) 30 kDa subunit [Desulfurobacterium thermolithotrophum DSM 11699]
MLEDIKERIQEEFGFKTEPYDTNILLVHGEKEKIKDFLKFLKHSGFNYPHTISVVDYTPKGEGFQINYIIENIEEKKFVIVRVNLLEDELFIPSVCDVFPALQPHEREAWEMFGIEFVGNPRLEVMLLPEWAKGTFPLRKSYDFEKHRKEKK